MIDWQGIYGHSQIKTFLDQLTLSGSIPQALLFGGMDGTGKDAFAFKFAEFAINKSLSDRGDSKLSFKAMVDKGLVSLIYALPRGKNEEAGEDPLQRIPPKEIDLIKEEQGKKVINPYYDLNIPGANQIKINSIREIIRSQSLNRNSGLRSFIIILEADRMRPEAQNSLLKILEEPPNNSSFILTTSRLEYILPTIKSRSWAINFGALSDQDVSRILLEHFELESGSFQNVLQLSGGSVSHILSILDSADSDIRENVLEFLRNTLGAKYNSGFKSMDKFYDGDYKRLILLIDLVSLWFRDLIRYRTGCDELFYNEYRATFAKFDTKYSHITPGSIFRVLEGYKNILVNTNTNSSVIAFNLMFAFSNLIFNYTTEEL